MTLCQKKKEAKHLEAMEVQEKIQKKKKRKY
jgi:hypothetical protein